MIRRDHLESDIILHYSRLHYTRHYGIIFTLEKAHPAPKNLHETAMRDTIKENYLISKIANVAGRKLKLYSLSLQRLQTIQITTKSSQLKIIPAHRKTNYVFGSVYIVLCCPLLKFYYDF